MARLGRAAPAAVAAGALLLVLALAVAYTRLAGTIAINSDQASIALEGQDLWRGNLLMSGWTFSSISVYVPDLVVAGAAVKAFGLGTLAVQATNGLLYALVVVVAAALAAGKAEPRVAAVRALLTAALLLAPTPGFSAYLWLVAGAHVGSTLVALLALLVLDRASARTRFFAVPLLFAGAFADPLSWLVSAVPVAVVALARFARRPRLRSDLVLALIALAALPAANLLERLIRRLGGFQLYPVDARPAPLGLVWPHAKLAIHGLITLFGFDTTVAGLVHGAGLAFVAFAFAMLAATAVRRRSLDPTVAVLLLGMAVDLAAFVLTTAPQDIASARYLIPFAVYAATVAGRAGGELLARPRLLPVAAAGLAAFALSLLFSLAAIPQAPPDPVAAYLLSRGVTYGVGDYWQANSTTVATAGRVTVRAVRSGQGGLEPYLWESRPDWYTRSDATFVVFDTTSGPAYGLDEQRVTALLGPPDEVHKMDVYVVLIWDRPLGPVRR